MESGTNGSQKSPTNDPLANLPPVLQIPLIKRKTWRAMPWNESKVERMEDPHKLVCFVPTESSPCDTTAECLVAVREIQKRNTTFKKWPDIPFHYLIGGDGYIYEGRGFKFRFKDFGNATMRDTLQVGYIGHYKDRDPPKEMVDLGMLLIEYGKQRNYVSEDYNYMECPLSEYYQYPPSIQDFWNSQDYKDFLATMPPPRPPRPAEPVKT